MDDDSSVTVWEGIVKVEPQLLAALAEPQLLAALALTSFHLCQK